MIKKTLKDDLVAGRRAHVLVVDDEAKIAKLIKTYLEGEGYVVTAVGSVTEMRIAIDTKKLDLIILDIVLPDEDGWSALRWLRSRSQLPVIMLTGKGNTVDKIVGLEMGADDYLAKPFDLRELLARLHSVLRRSEAARGIAGPEPDEAIRFSGWVLDLASQQLKSDDGAVVHITHAEYSMLLLLAQNPRRVITRDQLLDSIAARDWEPFDRSVDVHISNIRRKIDGDNKTASLIRTVRGTGYMFIPTRI